MHWVLYQGYKYAKQMFFASIFFLQVKYYPFKDKNYNTVVAVGCNYYKPNE